MIELLRDLVIFSAGFTAGVSVMAAVLVKLNQAQAERECAK